jgi:hypothetical protein
MFHQVSLQCHISNNNRSELLHNIFSLFNHKDEKCKLQEQENNVLQEENKKNQKNIMINHIFGILTFPNRNFGCRRKKFKFIRILWK